MLKMLDNKKTRFVFRLLPIAIILFTIIFWLQGKELSAETLLSYAPKNHFSALLFLMLLFAAKSVLVFVPIVILYIVVGSIFPAVPAIFINIIGTALCITIEYWIGFFLGSGYTEKLLEKYPKAREIVRQQHDNEWFFSYFLRVVNLLPVEIVSIYLGTLKVPYHIYIAAGMLGMLPGILSSTMIGISILNPASPLFICSILISVALSLISLFIYKRTRKRKNFNMGGD